MTKKTFHIKGMHCNSCAKKIEDSLEDYVKSVSVSYSGSKAEIEFDENKISEKEIIKKISDEGYEADGQDENERQKRSTGIFGWIFLGITIILLFFFIYKFFIEGNIQIPDIQFPGIGERTSILLLFFLGILTGFHCVSMCGGFVVSYSAKNAVNGYIGFNQHLVYGGSKIFSYALIGGIFGLIGGIFSFSAGLRGFVAIFAGIFMIFYAMSIFGFAFFRKFQFNPKFLLKISSKKYSGFYSAPFMTGLLSGLFIACGPLQAMYIYAMGSGNFLNGAVSLAAFGAGTLPVMLGFGGLLNTISHNTTRKILKFSGIIVLILGIIMLNRGMTLLGSPISYDSIKEKIISGTSLNSVVSKSSISNGVQVIKMDVYRYGFSPDSFALKKGVPVRWEINAVELTSCNKEIIVREYNLDIKLNKGINVVEFTPDKAGTIRWSCWMGMIPGIFIVTETGTASQQELNNAKTIASSSGSSCGMGGGCGCGG